MKTTLRALSAPAALALATPAFADAGTHHDLNIVQSILHWASQPTHGLALLFAAAAVIGLVVISRRQRG